MLDFKVFAVNIRPAVTGDELPDGSYCQRFVQATDAIDAGTRVTTDFGPEWELLEVYGPFERLAS
jgi:hypothetical protein